MTTTPYHPGERAAQARAGLTARADHSGRAVRADVPPAAADFLAASRTVVLGAADAHGRLWASLLTGRAGFLRAPDPATVEVGARPAPADPLAAALADDALVGAVVVDPATRRRMRVNGRSRPTPDGLRIAVDQVYANCPKYIQAREVEREEPDRTPATTSTGALTAGQQDLLATTDTFFVATRSATGDADASHRGGPAGFVQVLSPTRLRWPDYVGNAMLMTLGNLEQDPACGLLVVDPGTGATLQLTGTARVEWDVRATEGVPGAQRVVDLEVTGVLETRDATALRWTAGVPSPANPA